MGRLPVRVSIIPLGQGFLYDIPRPALDLKIRLPDVFPDDRKGKQLYASDEIYRNTVDAQPGTVFTRK